MAPMAKNVSDDDLGAATKALVQAVSLLTKAVGQGLTEASQEVGAQLAASLREASRDLADASAEAGRTHGARRRAERAARTRTDLVAAARRVFAEKGYEGASVQDVAAEAGFTKGAVYANFGGKEELLVAVARELADEDVARLQARPDRDLREALTEDGDDAASLARTLLQLEVYTYAVRHPDSRGALAASVGAGSDALASRLRDLRGGTGEPSQPDRDTALGLLAIQMFARVIGPLADPDGNDRAVADRLVDRLLAP